MCSLYLRWVQGHWCSAGFSEADYWLSDSRLVQPGKYMSLPCILQVHFVFGDCFSSFKYTLF